MGYQTGTLTGIKTWMVERGIRDRIAVWYLFVEKEKQKIGQIFAVIRKETEQKKAVKIAGKQKAEVLAERILDVYGDAVLRLTYTYVHNMSDAEDILQETLIRYLENRPVFENEKHEKGWLFRVAANLSKNKIAYNKIRPSGRPAGGSADRAGTGRSDFCVGCGKETSGKLPGSDSSVLL